MNRRKLIAGLTTTLIAAPAIIRIADLMPIRPWREVYTAAAPIPVPNSLVPLWYVEMVDGYVTENGYLIRVTENGYLIRVTENGYLIREKRPITQGHSSRFKPDLSIV